MLVLEMVGRRKNICSVEDDNTSEIYFPDGIYKSLEQGEKLGFLGIDDEDENQIARKMILVGLWCIQTNPLNRPSMCRVVEMLQGSITSLQMPPRPTLVSPLRSFPQTLINSSATATTGITV
ncbi:hypothetical protein MANES_14G106166v8 [Manihot esculenta]|uniref:Uncharacterized protein n=1 Tax=Manihot esculenta TaxID=3983 RepID=A0ACB7GFW8_MANES|nr:hypothetical protein MANES_14G106166v8 [Manihot esculenta]